MKRVLVAGATGYLGGFVARELKARDYFVRALARSPEKLVASSVDEIVEAEVTRPETLDHVCDGIDAVFSSIGITRQKNGLTFRDVDYQGNKNLLETALRAGVRKFVYVSVLHGPQLRHLDIVDAHEAFVDELNGSGIGYAVLRPTAYFSDMGEVFEMARRGRVWLVGSGESRVNAIHGADLAVACVEAIEGNATEIDVGGPRTMTWSAVAEIAFRVLGQPAKVTRLPEWLMWSVVRLVRLFNRHQGELLAFFTTMATSDVVAPAIGNHTLEAHYRSRLPPGFLRRSIVLVLVCGALMACTANRMHHPRSIEDHSDYSLAFIELDDQGELWAPSQLERAIDLIERLQKRSPIALQVYVHGWNSSAAPREDRGDSGAVYQFRRLLTKIHHGIEHSTGAHVPVVGVFVGWRGQVTLIPFLRELSFYNRRGAAERIAGASATETLYRILTTARQHPESRSVLSGHSFGAAIVEQAFSQAIIGSLLAAPGSEVPFPADLVVLFNPANSASSAKQLVDILARNRLKTYRVDEMGHRYERPLLISFTSASDIATRLYFPMGMRVKALNKRFRHYGSDQCSPVASQRWLYTHTAGHTPGLHSHRVTVGPRSADSERSDPATMPWTELQYRTEYDPITQQIGLSFDGSHHRFTIRRKPRALNDTPYWIMRVPRELIPDHGTIFTDDTIALVNAIFELTGMLKTGAATTLVRDNGVRPVAVLPRPDGTALVLDRSRRLYAVRRDSPRPILLGCFGEDLDPSDAIGLRVAGELAFVAARQHVGPVSADRCQTLVHPFQTEADAYRSGKPLRLSGAECFGAAAFDLTERRIYLSSEDSPTISVADLEDRGARPRVLVKLPGDAPLGALHFERAGPRLLALQGTRGLLWEVDLATDPPTSRVLSSNLGRPSALAFDHGRRRLYVTDARDGRIWALDCPGPCGTPRLWLEPGLLENPTALEVGLDGTLWIGDPESKLLLAIAPDGRIVWSQTQAGTMSLPPLNPSEGTM